MNNSLLVESEKIVSKDVSRSLYDNPDNKAVLNMVVERQPEVIALWILKLLDREQKLRKLLKGYASKES